MFWNFWNIEPTNHFLSLIDQRESPGKESISTMRGSFLSRVATCSYYLSRVTTCAACASAAYYIFKKREDPVVETFNELENVLELLERVDGHEQAGYAHITKIRNDCDEIEENVKELRKYTNIHIHEFLRDNPQYRRYFEERARIKETDPKLTD